MNTYEIRVPELVKFWQDKRIIVKANNLSEVQNAINQEDFSTLSIIEEEIIDTWIETEDHIHFDSDEAEITQIKD